MALFLLGFVSAVMMLSPVLGVITWMWKTDTRLLTRLYEQEWDANRRLTRLWSRGTTTQATGTATTTVIASWDEGKDD